MGYWRAAAADANDPINGYKMDRVGEMLRADSNAWWCVVCRRSSTKCLMALTPLRNARGVDGGVAGCWMLARRGRLSLRNSPNSGCTTFSCPMRKIERRSGLLQVGGGLRKIGKAGQAAAEAVQLDFRDI